MIRVWGLGFRGLGLGVRALISNSEGCSGVVEMTEYNIWYGV